MQIALTQAQQSTFIDEVPVGAVLVHGQEILAKAHNQTILLSDPTAHAEILALRKAAKSKKNYRLPGATLYVTIEPCIMCMGALIHARISRIVFGARDMKWGGCGSLYHLECDPRMNHSIQITEGICEKACREIIQHFFQKKRK
ncbi:tRNA-specific adenosine deaminase [Candidatus Magnetomorum sp. HK-1]|nr:tRNA-specific adenosine deaminase [Candidatus Magnetomorum sp. HK-1]